MAVGRGLEARHRARLGKRETGARMSGGGGGRVKARALGGGGHTSPYGHFFASLAHFCWGDLPGPSLFSKEKNKHFWHTQLSVSAKGSTCIASFGPQNSPGFPSV